MAIEETEWGTHRVRWRDENGVQRAKSFKTKPEAKRHEAVVLGDLASGRSRTSDPSVTVRVWADRWLAGAHNLKPGSRAKYRTDLDRYILPALGDVRLARLSADLIDDHLNAMRARGLAASSRLRQYRTIHRLCEVAIARGVLGRNPCDGVEAPRLDLAEMRFLTVDEVDALADTITVRYRAWVFVAAYAGPRWSELVGLRRGAVDGKRIQIVEQLLRHDGVWQRDTLKTKNARRTVKVPIFVADELAEHLERWSLAGGSGLVFPNQHGQPLRSSSFRNNVFQPALKRAGIDTETRIHDLRHTAAAFAIKAGAHPKVIMERLGHSRIATTMDLYGHLFDGLDDQLADALDDLRSRDAVTPRS